VAAPRTLAGHPPPTAPARAGDREAGTRRFLSAWLGLILRAGPWRHPPTKHAGRASAWEGAAARDGKRRIWRIHTARTCSRWARPALPLPEPSRQPGFPTPLSPALSSTFLLLYLSLGRSRRTSKETHNLKSAILRRGSS
jgi:hypothetical protein